MNDLLAVRVHSFLGFITECFLLVFLSEVSRVQTTPTNQLPKLQAGGEVVCKREKEELLSRPTSRAGGAPASQFTRGGPWLLSPGKQVTETQACGPMESQIRGNVLRHVPNGKQFCFPFVSQALDQPLTGKTSAGARASCGFQAAFAETGPWIQSGLPWWGQV